MLFFIEASKRWSDCESFDVESLAAFGNTLSIMLSLSSIRLEINLVGDFKLSDDVAFCSDEQQLAKSARKKRNRRRTLRRVILIGGGVFLLRENTKKSSKALYYITVCLVKTVLNGVVLN